MKNPKKTKTSQSLDLASSNSDASEQILERRQVGRFVISQEQFRLSETGKIYAVINIGKGGMGIRILDPEDRLHFTVKRVLHGSLNLDGKKFQITAQVVHSGRHGVGLEWHGKLTPDFSRALEYYTNPENLGSTLSQLPIAEDNWSWFHTHCGTDLLFRLDGGDVEEILFFLSGDFVKFQTVDGVKTGAVLDPAESVEVRGILRRDVTLLRVDPTPDSTKIEVAKRIILSSKLESKLKNSLVSCLK